MVGIRIPIAEPVRFVSVAKAARYLGVSEQRVRLLLKQGRMAGRKDEDGRGPWQVEFPPLIRAGRSGPRLGMKLRSSFPLKGRR